MSPHPRDGDTATLLMPRLRPDESRKADEKWKIHKSRVIEAFSQRGLEKTVDLEEFSTCNTTTIHDDTLRHTVTHYDILWNTTTHYNILWYTTTHCNTTYYDIPRYTTIYYDTLRHTEAWRWSLTWFSVSWLTGEGPLGTMSDLWQSDWPVLSSHFGRTEKMRARCIKGEKCFQAGAASGEESEKRGTE